MRSVLVVAFLLLFVLCVLPVALVVGDSFVAEGGGITFANYVEAFAPHYRTRILLHSTLLGVLSTLIALVLGVPYALFTTRIRVPLGGLFRALYVFPLVLPPLFMTMGWTQALNDMARSTRGWTSLGPGPMRIRSGGFRASTSGRSIRAPSEFGVAGVGAGRPARGRM